MSAPYIAYASSSDYVITWPDGNTTTHAHDIWVVPTAEQLEEFLQKRIREKLK